MWKKIPNIIGFKSPYKTQTSLTFIKKNRKIIIKNLKRLFLVKCDYLILIVYSDTIFYKYINLNRQCLNQMAQEKNQLRLGIEIKSLKNHEFTAQLYLAHKSIPQLNIKSFRSTPTQAIVNAKAEVQLNNAFRCYMFEANRSELKEKFSRSINLQLWHNDRIKKDVLLGIAKLNLQQILTQPFRKSKQSYAVVYDVYLPIDEVDEDENPIKKIGALRVIAYLQDLGPVSRLKQKGFDIKNFIQDYDIPEQNEYQLDGPSLPSQKYKNIEQQQKAQLNDLQHKVVWQLEVWKKSEQNRTRLILKQKQAQFWTNLSQQQRKSDLQKQKQFKKIEAALSLQQNKLKAKMNQLIKRQQKIVVYEQQLQNKINQVSREIFLKDEEIDRIKKRQKQQKTNLIKQKSNLQLEISKFRADNARMKVQLEQEKARKNDQNTPINKLKSELQHKRIQIKNLHNQLEKCMEVKQQYKIHFQKMRDQVIIQKSLVKEKQEQLITNNSEMMIMRNNLKHLQEKVKIMERQNYQNQQQYYQEQNYQDYEDGPAVYTSQRDKLIQQRRNLIQMNGYSPDDPLIQQYDRKIAAMN